MVGVVDALHGRNRGGENRRRRSPDDPREVLVTAANASHDTDTIASMAGNLAGAWLGAERLRVDLADWLAQLEGAR